MVNAYDTVAESYDQTRGGETRGDLYAGELEPRLLPGPAPVLEIGVGTGLVALGLQQRGRTVIGVDLSAGMLAKASGRLPGPLIQGDVCALPFRDGSLTNVVSVWMIQAVADPLALFREVFRVLRPGGRLLACPTNRPAFRDPIGVLLARMFVAIDKLTTAQTSTAQNGPAPAKPVVDANQILSWGQTAGFTGVAEQLPDERWPSDRDAEIKDIEERRWAPLVDLDDATYAAVAGPALTGLRELPPGPKQRRAVAHVVLLDKPGR